MLSQRLVSVFCCEGLQQAALTRAVRAAAASGDWLLLVGVDRLGGSCHALLASHLTALQEAAASNGAAESVELAGG